MHTWDFPNLNVTSIFFAETSLKAVIKYFLPQPWYCSQRLHKHSRETSNIPLFVSASSPAGDQWLEKYLMRRDQECINDHPVAFFLSCSVQHHFIWGFVLDPEQKRPSLKSWQIGPSHSAVTTFILSLPVSSGELGICSSESTVW